MFETLRLRFRCHVDLKTHPHQSAAIWPSFGREIFQHLFVLQIRKKGPTCWSTFLTFFFKWWKNMSVPYHSSSSAHHALLQWGSAHTRCEMDTTESPTVTGGQNHSQLPSGLRFLVCAHRPLRGCLIMSWFIGDGFTQAYLSSLIFLLNGRDSDSP